MNLKKPNFWDQKTPNLFAYLLLPLALIIQIFNYLKNKYTTIWCISVFKRLSI